VSQRDVKIKVYMEELNTIWYFTVEFIWYTEIHSDMLQDIHVDSSITYPFHNHKGYVDWNNSNSAS
jgi:hypothetical protein